MVPEDESILSGKHGIKLQTWQQEQGAEILHLRLQIRSRERTESRARLLISKPMEIGFLSKPKLPIPPKPFLI